MLKTVVVHYLLLIFECSSSSVCGPLDISRVCKFKNRIENIRIFLKFKQKWSRKIQNIYSYFEFQEIFCCSLPYFSYIPWIFPDWKGQSWWLRCEWKEYNDIVGIMGVCPEKNFKKTNSNSIKKTFKFRQELEKIFWCNNVRYLFLIRRQTL